MFGSKLDERALSLFSMDRPTDNRKLISREEMQAAITGAVKKADPDCEAFVGVIVERRKRSSLAEANWAIRGIKFGRADRNKAGEAVNRIVERMQRDFQSFRRPVGRGRGPPCPVSA